MRRAFLLGLAALAAVGCDGHGAQQRGIAMHTVGSGADQVWVFEPPQKPRSVVVFIHGQGGVTEDTPANHRPWLEHLASRGSLVLYPRYELVPGSAQSLEHLVRGLRAVRSQVGGRPVLAIGYSRGGWLVVAYAAVARRTGIVPRAVLSVFPASPERPLPDLRSIKHDTLLSLVVGDRDEIVGHVGASQILALLELTRYPPDLITGTEVRSHGQFVASHLSVLETSPAAQAAFWAPADRLVKRISR